MATMGRGHIAKLLLVSYALFIVHVHAYYVQCWGSDCSWSHPRHRALELDLGLAGSFLFPSDLGYSLYHRTPLHVRAVYPGEAELKISAQSRLAGLSPKAGSRTHILYWLELTQEVTRKTPLWFLNSLG